jgi:hypothetical protein
MTTAYATSDDGLTWDWRGTALAGRPGTWDARGCPGHGRCSVDGRATLTTGRADQGGFRGNGLSRSRTAHRPGGWPASVRARTAARTSSAPSWSASGRAAGAFAAAVPARGSARGRGELEGGVADQDLVAGAGPGSARRSSTPARRIRRCR